MRKSCSCFLLLLLVLSLFGCGNTTDSAPQTRETPAVEQHSTPAPTPAGTPVPEDGLKADGNLHVYLQGKGERLETPESSFIRYLLYFPDSEHLIINMNGKEYAFANVGPALWEGFCAAEVKGKYYNEVFKGKTEFHVNGYDGSNGDRIVLDYVD